MNSIYYINMYKKWWKTIVKLMVIAMFFTAIFSLLIPANSVTSGLIINVTGNDPAYTEKVVGGDVSQENA